MYLLAVPLLFAVGCAAAIQPAADPENAATQEPSGGERVLTGVLTYTPVPQTKSVEAYEGVEFRVGETPIESSDQVSHAALVGHDGQTVTVRCTMRTPPPPSMHESYPMDMDGRPLARPARCTVASITKP